MILLEIYTSFGLDMEELEKMVCFSLLHSLMHLKEKQSSNRSSKRKVETNGQTKITLSA